jgi:decaprenylphospho-beta-D-erythro-pentofuranosid-2-ulose 2-reductase
MGRVYCIILGSNSDIGQALAYMFASKGFNIILACREISNYQIRLKQDISIRYQVDVKNIQFDGCAYDKHDDFWDDFKIIPDVLISVFGYLGNQELALSDFEESNKIISSNYIGQVSLINRYVKKVRGIKNATIIGISSVAGDRGRKSNYLYGSAKAGFSAYLSGLRNDLFNEGIHVITVKPGFMRTKMIQGLNTPTRLTAEPNEVADHIYKAYKKKKNVVYVYPIWRFIMFIIINIPEFIFKRLKL